jgi:hypothetical protein
MRRCSWQRAVLKKQDATMLLESPGISRVHIALAIHSAQIVNIKETFCIAQTNNIGVFCEQPQPYPYRIEVVNSPDCGLRNNTHW